MSVPSTPRSTPRSISTPSPSVSTSASSSAASSPGLDRRRPQSSSADLTSEQKAFIMEHDDPRYYVEQLVCHMEAACSATKQKEKKIKRELAPLRTLLEGLKQYLGDREFLEGFVSTEHRGVDILGKFLGDTREQLKKISEAQSDKKLKLPPGPPRTMKDEVDAINCIRKITETDTGVKMVLTTPQVLENVALSMISKSLSSRLYTFVIMIRACDGSHGNERILEVLSHVKQQIRERVRFHAITQMILKESNRVELTALCLRFINTILATTPDLNQRVYLQYELELAEFSPTKVERSYEGEVPRSVRQELDFWHSHYLSIQSLQEALSAHKSRNELLRQEVDRQQESLWNYEHEKSELKEQLKEVSSKSEEYKFRIQELQNAVEKMSLMYRQKTGVKAETELAGGIDYLMKPVDKAPSEQSIEEEQTETGSETGSEAESVTSLQEAYRRVKIGIPPPPAPPSAPMPPPAPGRHNSRAPIMPNHPLPMMNWIPIHSSGKTVFKEINDERIFNELDFSDFEETFRLRDFKSSNKMQEKFQRLREKAAKRISLIEGNRAKNLVITLRKIPLSVKELLVHINHCNRDGLPEESAELLLNFLPTKEELKLLAEQAEQYNNFGEAEQYMFQLARLDRYEAKLRLMAFMGIYNDLVNTIQPEIRDLIIASKSVATSTKLRKIFEIILAFGNYMNSSRRGSAHGFRLDSLERLTFVKSTNRHLTFVNYLVRTIENCYPECIDWFVDLKLDIVKTASMESLTLDIQGLRKGLEIAKSERDRQPDNTNIAEFARRASDTITEIFENFRKAEEHYHHACTTYGENYKTIDPLEFFMKFIMFQREYEKAAAENKHKTVPMKPQRITKNGPKPARRADKTQINYFAGSTPDPEQLLQEEDKDKLPNGHHHPNGQHLRGQHHYGHHHHSNKSHLSPDMNSNSPDNPGVYSLTKRNPHFVSSERKGNKGPGVNSPNGPNR